MAGRCSKEGEGRAEEGRDERGQEGDEGGRKGKISPPRSFLKVGAYDGRSRTLPEQRKSEDAV